MSFCRSSLCHLPACILQVHQHQPQNLVFLLVFYMFFSAHISLPSTAIPNMTSHCLVFITESCIILTMCYIIQHLFFILDVIQKVFLIGCMALLSGYMVTLFTRHKSHFQHLHHTCLSPKVSIIQRATCIIWLLMRFFVLMYNWTASSPLQELCVLMTCLSLDPDDCIQWLWHKYFPAPLY